MIGYMNNGKQMSERQRRFVKEIIEFNYNKDEAYAEIINSKTRFKNYNEYAEVIEDYFNNTLEIENELKIKG